MSRTYIYITDICILIFLYHGNIIAQVKENNTVQDSVTIPLSIRAGVDLTGPAIYFYNKNILNTEGYIAVDVSEKLSIFLGAGYSDYSYSQYNYEYQCNGIFVKTGVDLNILKPEVSAGKYWAGVGIRYGLSGFTSGTPSFTHENYWGITESSLKPAKSLGHYLEISPGFRAELFKNFSIGWSINLRKLVYPGSRRDIRPLYFPGYGAGGGSASAGVCYYLSWNIPFKKIRVEIKPEEPEEPLDEETDQQTEVDTRSQSLGGSRTVPRFR